MNNPYEPNLIETPPPKPIVIPFSEKHLITHFIWFHSSFALALLMAASLEYGPVKALVLLLTQLPDFLMTCINGFVLWIPHALLVIFHSKSRSLDARLAATLGVISFFSPLLVSELIKKAGASIPLLVLAPCSVLFSLVVVAPVAVVRRVR